MKRIGLALVWSAAIGLTACQGKVPTTPSETEGNQREWCDWFFRNRHVPRQRRRTIRGLSVKLTANPTTIQPGQSATLDVDEQGRHVRVSG